MSDWADRNPLRRSVDYVSRRLRIGANRTGGNAGEPISLNRRDRHYQLRRNRSRATQALTLREPFPFLVRGEGKRPNTSSTLYVDICAYTVSCKDESGQVFWNQSSELTETTETDHIRVGESESLMEFESPAQGDYHFSLACSLGKHCETAEVVFMLKSNVVPMDKKQMFIDAGAFLVGILMMVVAAALGPREE